MKVSESGPARLWLRLMMRDHSTCLFTRHWRGDEMEGTYMCFHGGSSFDRGKWTVQKSY